MLHETHVALTISFPTPASSDNSQPLPSFPVSLWWPADCEQSRSSVRRWGIYTLGRQRHSHPPQKRTRQAGTRRQQVQIRGCTWSSDQLVDVTFNSLYVVFRIAHFRSISRVRLTTARVCLVSYRGKKTSCGKIDACSGPSGFPFIQQEDRKTR